MHSRYLTGRYLLDRLLALLILVAVSPLMGIVALVIVGTTGRPVLFRQERVGRHGRVFSIIKFRTMVDGAERIGGGYVPKGQDLITPIGKVLRATSLDELPQLVNILRGEMALIGPRPSLIDQYERYSAFQKRRLEVLPGVTGLAQVTYRNDALWSERIKLDVVYVDRAGPVMDLRIVLRTVGKVFTGSGVLEDQLPEQVDDLG